MSYKISSGSGLRRVDPLTNASFERGEKEVPSENENFPAQNLPSTFGKGKPVTVAASLLLPRTADEKE